jgi:hypothetical protein
MKSGFGAKKRKFSEARIGPFSAFRQILFPARVAPAWRRPPPCAAGVRSLTTRTISPAACVPYTFRMAPGRISTTLCFARHFASMKVSCGRCGHQAVWKPADIARKFPQPLSLEWARYRLCCTRCHRREAEIRVIDPPRRG